MNKPTIKPTFQDYVAATLQTQSKVIIYFLIAFAFVPFGFWSSYKFFWIAVIFAILGHQKWIFSFQPKERIKTKALVIASKRENKYA